MSGFIFYDQVGEIRLFMQCSQEEADQTATAQGFGYLPGEAVHPSQFFVSDGTVQPKAPAGPYEAPDIFVEGDSLSDIQARRWRQIKFQRDVAEAGGFETTFGRFDSDAVSQTKLIGIAVAAQYAQKEWSVTWTLQDNTSVVLKASDVLRVNQCLFGHLNAVHEQGRALRDAIYSPNATLDSVNSITWRSVGSPN